MKLAAKTRSAMMNWCSTRTLAVLVVAATPAMAQPNGHEGHEGHSNNSDIEHPLKASKPPADKPAEHGMDHGAMHPTSIEPAAEMDHAGMSMQSATPADARDPHENAGGYTRESGPYALPPEQVLHMADEHTYYTVLLNQFEYRNDGNEESAGYDGQAWLGTSYDRAVFKAEGEVTGGTLEEARTELLWGHAITNYWDTQLGVRYDHGEGPERAWLAIGIQGLAPYWFEVETTAYVGDNGRTALRFEADYELLLTQRLILQPSVEVNLYGKADEERGIGKGLAEADIGVRLRYEFSRRLAPYVGVEAVKKFGDTGDLVRAEGGDTSATRWVAGVRFWF